MVQGFSLYFSVFSTPLTTTTPEPYPTRMTDNRFTIIAILVEVLSAIGGALAVFHYGAPPYMLLVAALAPPALALVVILGLFAAATRNGENPFQ